MGVFLILPRILRTSEKKSIFLVCMSHVAFFI